MKGDTFRRTAADAYKRDGRVCGGCGSVKTAELYGCGYWYAWCPLSGAECCDRRRAKAGKQLELFAGKDGSRE